MPAKITVDHWRNGEDGMKSSGPIGRQGIRTQMLLTVAMALVIAIVTCACLLLIRSRLRAQVAEDLAQDLNHSVIAFQDLQKERIRALERENSLLAELPTLKALMTSGDALTIQDGAVDFWKLSGSDLLALTYPDGREIAAYTKGASVERVRRAGLKALLASPGKHYLIDGQELYVCSLRPLYFGSDQSGTLLGYVVSGVSIGRTVREISRPSGVEATFLTGTRVVASTLDLAGRLGLSTQPRLLSGTPQQPIAIDLGGIRFLAATVDLSTIATAPLKLVVLKSFEPAELSINRIDRTVLGTGALALLSGTVLMIALSRLVTRPLEELSKSVFAFGDGDAGYRIPKIGTREVRQLSAVFADMRSEIQQKNRTLLESERLATIGRMASSVSHDLRHYLAAIYANAEFLASRRLSETERIEIFAEIRAGVHGTTDLIESLLIFSRTGASIRRTPELMATLLERASAIVRAHPDAEHVLLLTHYGESARSAVCADAKQIERAICNLLLNACQAVRADQTVPTVEMTLEIEPDHVIVNVKDNGDGVSQSIRDSLFEPFVSEGKQKGTGLGLTLAHRIAVEHGGGVILLKSRPGETVFQMKIARDLQTPGRLDLSQVKGSDQVNEHGTLPY